MARLGLAQQHIADHEIDLAATRALLRMACEELDAGHLSTTATSVAKTFGAEAIDRIVDRSIQLCGGLGVHRWSIAVRAVKEAAAQPTRR